MCCSRAAESPHPSLPSFCTTQHKLYRIQNCSDGDMFSHVSLYLIRGCCLRLNLGRFNYNLSDHFVCTSNLSCTPSVCTGEVSFSLVGTNIRWPFSVWKILKMTLCALFWTNAQDFSLWNFSEQKNIFHLPGCVKTNVLLNYYSVLPAKL